MLLIPRQHVFDTYWRFAAERQRIFFRRLQGDEPPWTQDPILSSYKFCNAYRASDRTSQYLIRHVIYAGSQEEEEVIFRILLFKLFNRIETWQRLQEALGTVELRSFDFTRYATALQQIRDAGHAIYTGAYTSCANKAFGYDRKHLNHLALLDKMMLKDQLHHQIICARSMEEVYRLLAAYPLIGPFMAYQLAIDLNYSDVITFSENSFTVAGPGAERGIRKCFLPTNGNSSAEVIQWMTEHQQEEFARLGIRFQTLWGRLLHCIDCQNLFCELDKYSRIAFPELKSNRHKIKARFQPTLQPIRYFFPPKWNINHMTEGNESHRKF